MPGTTNLAALAYSLDGLGTRLYELARPRDAAPLLRETVEICRTLAATDPNSYLPSLSAAVHNLGNVLSDLGRRDESLACARESVRIDRRLVAANPGTYRPAVARTLHNLSVNVSNTGDRKRALTLIGEALEIFRPLAEANPAVYPAVAARRSPGRGGDRPTVPSGDGGGRRRDRPREARAAAQRAREIYLPLAEEYPRAFADEQRQVDALLKELPESRACGADA